EDLRETWNIYFGKEKRALTLSSFTLALGLYSHSPLLIIAGSIGVAYKFYSPYRDAGREELVDR
ncbi:MAG: hypothetical protein AABW80_01890, partial [Nanoarchaeota archaeon]